MHIFRRLAKSKNSAVHAFIADLMYVIALIAPIMTIPQVIKIWTEKKAAGVSLETWGAYTFVSLIWFLYGFAHKEKPLALANFFLFIFDFTIVVGIILFR